MNGADYETYTSICHFVHVFVFNIANKRCSTGECHKTGVHIYGTHMPYGVIYKIMLP